MTNLCSRREFTYQEVNWGLLLGGGVSPNEKNNAAVAPDTRKTRQQLWEARVRACLPDTLLGFACPYMPLYIRYLYVFRCILYIYIYIYMCIYV